MLLAAVVGLAEFASRSSTPVMYLVFPLLIWAALRFGQRGATLGVAITAVFTVWNTTHYHGPFHFESVTRSVLNTQLFIAVAALSTLCLAAVVSERERFADAAARRPGRALISASDDARRRLEHDLHDGAQLRLTWLALRLRDAAGTCETEPKLRRARSWRRRRASCSSRSTSCGSSRTASTRRCSSTSASAEAIKSLALRSSIPVKLLEVPPSGWTPSAETVGYYVIAEAIANAQKHSDASVIEVRACRSRRHLAHRDLDDGGGGAVERPGSGLEGLRDRAGGHRRHDAARQPPRRRHPHRGRRSPIARLSAAFIPSGRCRPARRAVCWSVTSRPGRLC